MISSIKMVKRIQAAKLTFPSTIGVIPSAKARILVERGKSFGYSKRLFLWWEIKNPLISLQFRMARMTGSITRTKRRGENAISFSYSTFNWKAFRKVTIWKENSWNISRKAGFEKVWWLLNQNPYSSRRTKRRNSWLFHENLIQKQNTKNQTQPRTKH